MNGDTGGEGRRTAAGWLGIAGGARPPALTVAAVALSSMVAGWGRLLGVTRAGRRRE